MKPYQILWKENTHEKERKGNEGQGPKYMHTNNPTKVGHKEEMRTTKNWTLH